MTYDKLLVKLMVMGADESEQMRLSKTTQALRAVVKLHKPKINGDCPKCVFMIDPMGKSEMYPHPCPTIQAIEKELI